MLFEPIPYRSALREECTHVLVLRTRPDGVSVTGEKGGNEGGREGEREGGRGFGVFSCK
jgi:hypothetical protein